MLDTYKPSATPHFSSWKLCGWAGYAYVITILIAWAGIAGFLPPPAEYLSVEETYQYYSENSFRIRLGMMLTLVFNPLYYIWGAAVSRVLQHIEGPKGTLSLIQLMGAFGTVVVTWGCCVAWEAAAFDVEMKSPEDIKTLADHAWMWFATTVMVSVTQFVAFGCVCLIDKNANPLLPRWLGWFSLAMGISMLVAVFIPFFRTGPFSWHGLFCYYIALFDYFLWIIVVTYYVSKAIKRLKREFDLRA